MKYTLSHTDDGAALDFELLNENTLTGRCEKIAKWRIKVEEEAICDALIRRGWTPPSGDDRNRIKELENFIRSNCYDMPGQASDRAKSILGDDK